jgi:hypothetical protein
VDEGGVAGLEPASSFTRILKTPGDRSAGILQRGRNGRK